MRKGSIKADVLGFRLELETRPGLFSPEHADRGTLAMLSVARFEPGMQVLDLGCGCGIVGIAAAKICGEENITMCDIDPVAVETARENARLNGVPGVDAVVSDGLKQVEKSGFDLILSNPPYQTDFSVAKSFIEKGFNRLKVGGTLLMVTKRLDWYRNKIKAIFGGVRVYEIDGYYVFEAQRRGLSYAQKAKKK
ncbi:MAG: methyltransferase domain-containing protein [Clostridiales bacterium]|nr:methyltransferase domain-containing protein [Clostridiales bacterium]